jgi:hypothetical protein
MTTLNERIEEVQTYYGDRLVKWEPGGHPGTPDNPSDGVFAYKAYIKDKNNSNIVRTDIVKIWVLGYGTQNEIAFWENRDYVPETYNFNAIVQNKINEKVSDGTFKHAEIMSANQELKTAIIKAIKSIAGNNEVKYFIVSFDKNDNIASVEQTAY